MDFITFIFMCLTAFMFSMVGFNFCAYLLRKKTVDLLLSCIFIVTGTCFFLLTIEHVLK